MPYFLVVVCLAAYMSCLLYIIPSHILNSIEMFHDLFDRSKMKSNHENHVVLGCPYIVPIVHLAKSYCIKSCRKQYHEFETSLPRMPARLTSIFSFMAEKVQYKHATTIQSNILLSTQMCMIEFLPIKEHIETPNDKITTFFVFYQKKYNITRG